MKRFLTIFLTFLTFVVFSQDVKKSFIYGTQEIDETYLVNIIEIRINKIRKNNGLDTLIKDENLRLGSKKNSQNCFDNKKVLIGHTESGLFYENVFLYNRQSNKTVTYEHICDEIINRWMNSQTHKDNILKRNVTKFGTGLIYDKKLTRMKINNIHNGVKSVTYENRIETFIWLTMRFI